MNKILTLIVLFFATTNLIAQDNNTSNGIKLETPEDYKKTEQLFLAGTDWFVNTPISETPAKRKEINAFLLKWMMGSPNVSIELVSGIVPLDCPDCMMAFMSGWAKYSIKNNYSKDKIAGAVAGAENAIDFYTKNKAEIGKNSDMEKLIKQQKKGKLNKFIKSKF